MANTPAGVYYPPLTNAANLPSEMLAAANSIDPLIIGSFASAAARAAAITAPVDGQLSYNQATKSLEQYSTALGGWTSGAWVVPALSNSWVAFGAGYAAPQYSVVGGEVVITGVMKSGTVATTVFTLPAGVRPATIKGFITASNTGSCRIDITAAGVVTVGVYLTNGSNVSVFFDGVSFRAEQ